MDSKLAASPRRRQELSILTSYSESVFLLVSQLSIGRKPIELLPSPGGGGFVLQCEWPYFQLPFQKVLVPVSELLQSCGASRMGKFWSEPSPVFDVDFDSQASIQQMIGSLESGLVYEGMESIILPLIQIAWKETNPDTKLEWKLDISLELLQVLPNVDTKDAIIHRVSSSNSSMCVHLWNERKVFDIGALLRWYRSKPLGGIAGESPTESIKLLDLVRELKEVVGWMRLGLELRIPKHTLESVRCQYGMFGEDMCMTEMLSTWLDSRAEEPTWAEVVSAVSRMGNRRVARRIAESHGLALAVLTEANTAVELPSDVMAPGDPLVSLRREMEVIYRAAEDNDLQLELCTRKKRKLEDDLTEIRHNCDVGQRYTEMLAKDKESLELKLEEREKEIRSLQAQQLEYERKIRKLEVKLATAGTKAKQKHKEQLRLVKQEKEELVERIEAKQKEVGKLFKKVSKLTVKLEGTRRELSITQGQLDLKHSQFDEAQRELQLVRDQRDKLRNQLEIQEKALDEAAMQSDDSISIKPPTRLQFRNWRRCRDMPFGVNNAQAVLLDGRVYVGGGYTHKDEDRHAILIYTPERDEWSRLPQSPVRWFAMASVNHQLMLAGGQEVNGDKTSMLTVWDSTSCSWVHPYPPVPNVQSCAAAVGYQQFLVVVGPSSDSVLTGPSQASVEVLDTSTLQWHTAHPLPVACDSMASALLGSTLYLIGGISDFLSPTTQVFSTSLPTLISHAVQSHRYYHTPSTVNPAVVPMWENLSETSLLYSAVLAFSDSILAVGGMDDLGEYCSSIHIYNPADKEWMKVGDVPVRRSRLTCVVLSSGELLVSGGRNEHDVYSNEVYKFNV